MKRIFLYDLERAFLIFLLLSNLKKDRIFIIGDYDNFIKKTSINILKNYTNITMIVLDSKKLRKNLISRILYIKFVRKKLSYLIKEIESKRAFLYGVTEFILAKEIFFKENFVEIEDGMANYTFKKLEKLKRNFFKEYIVRLIRSFFRVKVRKGRLGYAENTIKVYLTENLCKEIPNGLEEKAEIINLKELWNKKSEEEKRIILNIFNFNEEILKKVNENTIVLFTQPLSEDKRISEEEKIDLYSKILKKYENESIIIKPHPREKTDYSKYFPSYYVMKEKYPVEILELVGINIKKAVTIFSSAVFGLGKDIAIDFYGTEIHSKLFEIFGTQDKVMKRNAFLD